MKIAIITDIHEDIESLKKALKMIELEKCDSIICLGDILGYPYMRGKYENSRNASECIKLIKSNCSVVLLGNHDIFHLKKFPQNSDGFCFPANWYELSSEEKRELASSKVWNYSDDYSVNLNENEISYLNSLSEYCQKEIDNKKILFSHFVYPNFTGYITNSQTDSKKLEQHFSYLKKNNYDLSICGHMHIEGIGLCYETNNNLFSHLFKGFIYYSYGEKKIKNKSACITIPALADNSQVNGFAILNTGTYSISSVSLNTNRRFIL